MSTGTSIISPAGLEFGGTYLMDIEPNQIPDDLQVPETVDKDPLMASVLGLTSEAKGLTSEGISLL